MTDATHFLLCAVIARAKKEAIRHISESIECMKDLLDDLVAEGSEE